MARQRYATASRSPALPAGVRAMNAVSALIFAAAGVALLAAGVLWLTRSPLFTIRALALEGDLAHSGAKAVRARVLPKLAGNFFSLDLARAQAAFDDLPWVRQAVVRRVWPNRLAVRLEEHRAAALWGADDGKNPLLVNTYGELFEANLGDVDEDALPRLDGPGGSSAAVWAMYGRLQPLMSAHALPIRRLVLSGRRSWRVTTEHEQTIELGRGSDDEVIARAERFLGTLPEVAARYGSRLVAADLRHTDGYALRLQGVTTLAASAAAGGGAPAPRTH